MTDLAEDFEDTLSEMIEEFAGQDGFEINQDDILAAVNVCIDEGKVDDVEAFKGNILTFFETLFEVMEE